MVQEIRIAKSVNDQLVAWNLPQKVRDELWKLFFVTLPNAPDTVLKEVIVPFADMRTMPATISDASNHPYMFWFVFAVRIRDGGWDVESVIRGEFAAEN